MKAVSKMNADERSAHLNAMTKKYSAYGLTFTNVDTSQKSHMKYTYIVNGNQYINTENEITWMLGIWDGKSIPFASRKKKDEVCGYWRSNHDLLQISVEIGMLSPEIAEKIKKGSKLTHEEAELVQANVKSKKNVVPTETLDNVDGFSEDDKEFNEGELRQVTTNRYERNREAREKCIELKGCKCEVCGIDFKETYGEIGEGFIHVHHVTPISSKGKDYKLDIDNDLVPVCPNCHAMMHRKNPPFSVEELKKIILTNKK